MKKLILPLLSATFFTTVIPAIGMDHDNINPQYESGSGSTRLQNRMPVPSNRNFGQQVRYTPYANNNNVAIERQIRTIDQLVDARIAEAIIQGKCINFLMSARFEQENLKPIFQTLKNSITALGANFFKQLDRVLTFKNNTFNDYFDLLTQYNFVSLTYLQAPEYQVVGKYYKQYIHAHSSGLILRVKDNGSFSASIYTENHTQSIINYLKDPHDDVNISNVKKAFDEKCSAEACKLIISLKSTYVKGNNNILVEPVPNHPGNVVTLREIIGDRANLSLSSSERVVLSKYLSDKIMSMGHYKIYSNISLADSIYQQVNYELPPEVDYIPHYLETKEETLYWSSVRLLCHH